MTFNMSSYKLLFLLGLTALLFSACSEESTVQKTTIPIKLELEEKSVFVDTFFNLTGNDDFNIFENGLADMLEQSLNKVNSVNIVPKDLVKKHLAVSASEGAAPSVLEIAKQRGAQWLLDGVIERGRRGNYKIYGNLTNLHTNEVKHGFAVAEFKNKDDVIVKINEFVKDVTSRISKNPEDLQESHEFSPKHYEFYRVSQLVRSAFNQGRNDIAISTLESFVKKLLADDDVDAEKDQDFFEYQIGRSRYYLMQLYVDVGDDEKAQAQIDILKRYSKDEHPVIYNLIRGIENEINGNLFEAENIYNNLINEVPYEKYYYLRLAAVYEKNKNFGAAINVLNKAKSKLPNTSILSSRIAELELTHKEDKAFDIYTESKGEMELIQREVVTSLIRRKIEVDAFQDVPLGAELNVPDQLSGHKTERHAVSGKWLKKSLPKILDSLDYACEDETNKAVRIAAYAIKSGKTEAAHDIAKALHEHGTASNSSLAYNQISALAFAAEGEYQQAMTFVDQLHDKSSQKYFTIGTIYMYKGNINKAAYYMEKSLKYEVSPHPLMYYNIANAYSMAGNFEKWHKYNQKFFIAAMEKDYLPAKVKEKLKNIKIQFRYPDKQARR